MSARRAGDSFSSLQAAALAATGDRASPAEAAEVAEVAALFVESLASSSGHQQLVGSRSRSALPLPTLFASVCSADIGPGHRVCTISGAVSSSTPSLLSTQLGGLSCFAPPPFAPRPQCLPKPRSGAQLPSPGAPTPLARGGHACRGGEGPLNIGCPDRVWIAVPHPFPPLHSQISAVCRGWQQTLRFFTCCPHWFLLRYGERRTLPAPPSSVLHALCPRSLQRRHGVDGVVMPPAACGADLDHPCVGGRGVACALPTGHGM